MKKAYELWIRRNMVDVLFWLVMLYFAIRYGVLDWRIDNGFLLVFFMCFYGAILIFRLGVRNNIQEKLIKRCKDNKIDISDIIPF